MDRRELPWILAVVNLLGWLVVIAVLYEADAIGEDAATLEEPALWLLLIAALIGVITSAALSLRFWSTERDT